MYDYERLRIDTRNARSADPHGMYDDNHLEREAKLTQLREMVDDPDRLAFVVSEILEML
jgi:hypothetical protein